MLAVLLLTVWAMAASLTSVHGYRAGADDRAQAAEQRARADTSSRSLAIAEGEVTALRRLLAGAQRAASAARVALAASETELVRLEDRVAVLASEKAAAEDVLALRSSFQATGG